MDLASVPVPAVLDCDTVVEFAAAVAAAVADPDRRVVVLEGSIEDTFCRGLDLGGVEARLDEAARAVRTFAECLVSLRQSTRPTLAVIDGAALGGGVGVAAACDVVLATPSSVFGLPELLTGLLPAIVLPLLLERVSQQKARLLALQATSIGAEQACQLGLVDTVVAPEALQRAVSSWKRVLARPDPEAVGALKRHMAANLRTVMLDGAEITAARLRTPEVQLMLRAVDNGEAAPWLTR